MTNPQEEITLQHDGLMPRPLMTSSVEVAAVLFSETIKVLEAAGWKPLSGEGYPYWWRHPNHPEMGRCSISAALKHCWTRVTQSPQPAYRPPCPITRREWFLDMENPDGEEVPTYGGPFDSYTVPYVDDDGDLRCERYDHDAGEWVEGGEPLGVWLTTQQPLNKHLPPWLERSRKPAVAQSPTKKVGVQIDKHTGGAYLDQREVIESEMERIMAQSTSEVRVCVKCGSQTELQMVCEKCGDRVALP